jgi:hypothetical protein
MAATIASSAQTIMRPLAVAIRRSLSRSWAIAAVFLLLAIAFSLDGRHASAADTAPAMRSWIVQELKGAAFSRPRDADDGQWQDLRTGARIEPGSVVRTDGSGRIELTNGIDRIRLSPSSEIELPVGLSGDPFTRVIHWIGTAFFQVGKRPAPQFEVDTPYIVAIVKGTKFTTTVSDAGASIKVSEGIVGVSATAGGSSIDVTAGGSASVSAADSDTVTPGPSGDATPTGARGKGSSLVGSSNNPSADGDVEAGGALSASADDGHSSGTTARGGRGTSHGGGNGNGRGRDGRENDGNGAVIRNGGGQGGVGGDDDDNGGGCFGTTAVTVTATAVTGTAVTATAVMVTAVMGMVIMGMAVTVIERR